MICENCHHRFRGNFCSHCGHQAAVERFDMPQIAKEGYAFSKSITILFFLTIYRLTYKAPQHLKTFLFKDREYLLSCIEYLFFSGTVVSILTIKFKFFKTGFNQVEPGITLYFLNNDLLAFVNHFFSYAEEYSSLTNIISIPCFALCSFLIFYKEHYSFGEHLIINTYIAAQQALFLLLLTPVIFLLPAWKEALLDSYIAVSIVYNFFVYFGLFTGSKLPTAFKAVVCLILAYFLGMVFNMAIYYLLMPYKEIIDPFI